jgi:hypothetical protein
MRITSFPWIIDDESPENAQEFGRARTVGFSLSKDGDV